MAKLSAHNEMFRYFSVRYRGLIAVMDDGIVLRRTVYSNGWKVLSRKKADVSLDEWKAIKRRQYDQLAEWKRKTTTLPSEKSLQRWVSDCMCPTPTGYDVEPDGAGPDGVPSWLRLLGMI